MDAVFSKRDSRVSFLVSPLIMMEQWRAQGAYVLELQIVDLHPRFLF